MENLKIVYKNNQVRKYRSPSLPKIENEWSSYNQLSIYSVTVGPCSIRDFTRYSNVDIPRIVLCICCRFRLKMKLRSELL